jgi:hypothetical protein
MLILVIRTDVYNAQQAVQFAGSLQLSGLENSRPHLLSPVYLGMTGEA